MKIIGKGTGISHLDQAGSEGRGIVGKGTGTSVDEGMKGSGKSELSLSAS